MAWMAYAKMTIGRRDEIMAEPAAPAKGPLPPYIAFKTLIDLIERMEREEPPKRVDPSYLDSYAGGYRPTVISNLQTLGLLTKTGEPTPTLLALVAADEPRRKQLVADLIGAHYSDVLALGKNSTQGQFLEAFAARGASGDTRRKAVSFFLKACAYAGITTGTHWKTPPASATGTRRPKAAKSAQNGGTPPKDEPRGDSGDPSQDVATVRLRSGGTLTLALSGSSLTMPKDDRNFVFGIVDLMQEYDEPDVSPEQPAEGAAEPDED